MEGPARGVVNEGAASAAGFPNGELPVRGVLKMEPAVMPPAVVVDVLGANVNGGSLGIGVKADCSGGVFGIEVAGFPAAAASVGVEAADPAAGGVPADFFASDAVCASFDTGLIVTSSRSSSSSSSPEIGALASGELRRG